MLSSRPLWNHNVHQYTCFYWPGYYPNLNEDQFYAATLVNNCIIKDGLDFYSDGEAPLLKVLRFLRAKNFDVSTNLDPLNEIKPRASIVTLRTHSQTIFHL